MFLSSIEVARDAPGLVLGQADVSSKWKKKSLQILSVTFGLFGLTSLLLRLQHQIIKQKWNHLRNLQNSYLIPEFNRLGAILMLMEDQRKKALKIEISFEVTHQIAISLVLVLFSISQTRTESAFETLFAPDKNDLYGVGGVYIFSGSMVLSFMSFMLKASFGNHTSWKSRLALGGYAALTMAMRLWSIVVCFIPSLGLMNVLRHYQVSNVEFLKKFDYLSMNTVFPRIPPLNTFLL